MQTLRVKLNSTVKTDPGQMASVARPLLQKFPDLILGSSELGEPVRPTERTMFGPRGGAILEDGSIWVADTGHHRLLGWKSFPKEDGTAADIIIGQPDFYTEGRNAKGPVTGSSLNVPTGVTACGRGIAVADAWNHRVLIWNEVPSTNNTPADVVLGQADLLSGQSNRRNDMPDADTLFWCYAIYWDGEHLWVGDTGNRRVLMWNGIPERTVQPDDLVLGQDSFRTRNENDGGEPDAKSMRWPHAIALIKGRLCITDAGNNRVMIWNSLPTRNNQPCDIVLGQKDFNGVDHNQGSYFPTGNALNMPYGIASAGEWLMAADTASSRLVGWHVDTFAMNAPAQLLAGQFTFNDKGDNRWSTAVRDSICWPYNVYAKDDMVLLADSGNNRISLWRVSDEVKGSLS